MDERKIPTKYIPKSLSEKDRRKQLKSIEEGVDRPKVKSFKSKRSNWTRLANSYFGVNNTSKVDIARILSKGNKKRYKELMNGFDEIFDKGMKAYYTSGSRPNQTPYSWAYARLFSVLFGGKSRDIDSKEVEKYNIPLLSKKQKGNGDGKVIDRIIKNEILYYNI
jgi:hypothetical protein